MAPLAQEFFARDTLVVARELLGKRFVRILHGLRLSGLISETEAYGGPDDQASHAYRLTRRSAIMYGPAGRAYVYLIYGRNFCLNAVTEAEGRPGAVLVRGLLPEEGIDVMRSHRGLAGDGKLRATGGRGLTDGPGKLCQALAIDLTLNGADLTRAGPLYVEAGWEMPAGQVLMTPRIGVRGDEETRSRPWRFLWQPDRLPGA